MKNCMCKLMVLAVMLLAMCAEAWADVEINETNFPDANFRNYVLKERDTTKDGFLQDPEITSAQSLSFVGKEITSLKGIEHFTHLTELDCSGNQLTTLDLSKNTALTFLRCADNQLTTLDLSKNAALTELRCDNNQLKALDLSNNTALTVLHCSNNQLKALDLSKNTALTQLACGNNQLTALDVSKNNALTALHCEGNQLMALDLSNNTTLAYLMCDFIIDSDDNGFTFNIADFLKAYKSLDDELLSVEFKYYYNNDEYYSNHDNASASVILDPEKIAANNVVSFTPPEGTFKYIGMILRYSDTSTKEVRVYPFSGSSSGTAPIITTQDLPDGSEGSAYSADLEALGAAPIAWMLSDGSLPTGLTFSPYGLISGTPTTPGVYSFTVKVSNIVGSATKLFTIVVPFSEVIPPKITTTALTQGYTGSPYGFRLQADGTSAELTSLTWSANSLPEGLTLSTSGYLSGTPTAAGTYSFDVQVSNSQGSDSKNFTINISELPSNAAPKIITETPEPAAASQPYTCQLMASGTPPLTWTIAKGKLPAGLDMDSSGLITGTPTKAGKKSVTITAANDDGTDQKKITLTVYDLPAITTTSLKDATVGKKYSASIKKKGSKPLTWQLEGSLPQGISFSKSKGQISGKPTVNDKGMIRLILSNPAGEISKVYTLTVKGIAPAIKLKSLKAGTYGKQYTADLKLKGTEPITVLISGDLPEGLEFDTSRNVITGIPSEVCTGRQITVFAVNMGGVDQKTYSLTVKAAPPKITTKKLPDAVKGNEYSFEMEAEGTPTIIWVASGLPSGLSMNISGEISGTPTTAGKFSVKVSAANSSKTASKSYKLIVTAPANTRQAMNSKAAAKTLQDFSRNTSTYQSEANHAVIPINEVNALDGDNAALKEEYVVIAKLGTLSVDESGMHDFTVTLSDDAYAGKELLYLAGSSEPSKDDAIAEFYDETGKEVSTVPAHQKSRKITVSVWLKKGITYTPSLAVKH